MTEDSLFGDSTWHNHLSARCRGPRPLEPHVNLNHLSPGVIGMYWLGASMLTTAGWSATATLVKRAARKAARG